MPLITSCCRQRAPRCFMVFLVGLASYFRTDGNHEGSQTDNACPATQTKDS
jgi:hypothetical protein